MSASFRNAELIRIGKGYFWKSLGNSTTASHCSPSLPDRKPGENGNVLVKNVVSDKQQSDNTKHRRCNSTRLAGC